MFIDSTALPEHTKIEADVCIIGAGAAGITLARDLAGSNRRIAVFESGDFTFSQETQQLYDGEVVGGIFPPLKGDRLRFFGGSTNHWAGSCRPFDASDFEGWPFGYSAMEPHYRRAQDICQLGPFTYETADWQTDQARPFEFGPAPPLRTGVFQYSPPTRFGEVYRPDLEAAKNVSVYLNANLINIETNDTASEVSGLTLACLNGRRFQAYARYYVLATGGIENPRLLLNSDHVQKGGLGNGFDLVGRYFMDHAVVFSAATVLFTDPRRELGFYDIRYVRDQQVQGYLFPSPEFRRQEGLPAFGITMDRSTYHYKQAMKQSLRSVFRNLMSGRIPDHLASDVSRVLEAVEFAGQSMYQQLMHDTRETFSTSFIAGGPPDPGSRVTLNDSVDALGLRRVKLDWRIPADFERNMRRAHEILAKELGRNGIGRLRMHPGDAVIENGSHHMGTTRMHTDSRQGVVDEHCRVHGIANLFIAGSSVFPAYSFDDPTLTIVALSLRLSEHLRPLIN